MPVCKKCNNKFPNRIIVDGHPRILSSRKYCLDCSPYGLHNTKKLTEFRAIEGSKLCPRCNTSKDISEFYKRREDEPSSYCKSCSDTYSSDRWIRLKSKAVEYLGSKCICCHNGYHYSAMQFHHVEPNQKEFDWGQLRLRAWNKITYELDKCVLLCANCHSMVHGQGLNLWHGWRDSNPH